MIAQNLMTVYHPEASDIKAVGPFLNDLLISNFSLIFTIGCRDNLIFTSTIIIPPYFIASSIAGLRPGKFNRVFTADGFQAFRGLTLIYL